jgi:CxxC-x17-CxxC domain-containing protein
MGKTAMIQNMAVQDIQEGKGIGFVDPHGEASEALLDFIPSNRINDVIYFNPADLNYPVAFNVMEKVDLEHRHLVAGGLMGVFKKIWPDVWSARMEYILNNTILALLEYPGATLLGVNRMLSDPEYRKKVVDKITDPVVKAFWVNEFSRYSQTYETEATAAIQNKVGQFISAPLIRNIIGQVRSSIDMREVMDKQKILILNLSKGRIGEDNSTLLGALLITKLQLAAMSRVDIPEEKRKDFYLYVDEFQNFATESFATILSEARKYRLALILAHQYIAQMEEKVRDAVFGNVGTIISFRVGAEDAEHLEKEFSPEFMAQDIVNLAKYQIYLKLMIDGLAGRPFSGNTLPPFPGPLQSNRDKIIKVCREKYGTFRKEVEESINEWAGFADMPEMPLPKKQPVLYDAKCASCGKPTKVVFPPDGVRPVYCKTCLKKTKAKPADPVPAPVSENLPPISEKHDFAAPFRSSLNEALEKETVSFGGKLRKVVDPAEERKKKRKPVNLEELKKTLDESLSRFKKSQ